MNEANVKTELNRLIGYALTCKTYNTQEWMEGLAHRINLASEALGTPDHCEFDGSRFSIYRNTVKYDQE